MGERNKQKRQATNIKEIFIVIRFVVYIYDLL